MNKKKLEAYRHYHDLYPGDVVMFHVGDAYVALLDDALRVSQSHATTNVSGDEACIPDNDARAISELGELFRIHLIDYRNDDGEYDFPDIKRLQTEKDEDY